MIKQCFHVVLFRARAHWPLCLATGGRVFVAGIFILVGNHYFQALASTLQFVAQVCDRLWLVPCHRQSVCIHNIHVALVCSGPPQKRGHLWLNKVASVLGPLELVRRTDEAFVAGLPYNFLLPSRLGFIRLVTPTHISLSYGNVINLP